MIEVMVLGFSASCIVSLPGEFLLYAVRCVDSAMYHDSATRCALFICSRTPPDWSREGFPDLLHLTRTAAAPNHQERYCKYKLNVCSSTPQRVSPLSPFPQYNHAPPPPFPPLLERYPPTQHAPQRASYSMAYVPSTS